MEAGELTPERYRAYLKLRAEIADDVLKKTVEDQGYTVL